MTMKLGRGEMYARALQNPEECEAGKNEKKEEAFKMRND